MAGLKAQSIYNLCALTDVVVADCRATKYNILFNYNLPLKAASLDIPDLKVVGNNYTLPILGTICSRDKGVYLARCQISHRKPPRLSSGSASLTVSTSHL